MSNPVLIGLDQRHNAYRMLIEIGFRPNRAEECVERIVEKLNHGLPYEAQGIAMEYLDLDGVYYLFACLCR